MSDCSYWPKQYLRYYMTTTKSNRNEYLSYLWLRIESEVPVQSHGNLLNEFLSDAILQ